MSANPLVVPKFEIEYFWRIRFREEWMAWAKCTEEHGDVLYLNLDRVRYMAGETGNTVIFFGNDMDGEGDGHRVRVNEAPR